jgi:hypothetical protein
MLEDPPAPSDPIEDILDLSNPPLCILMFMFMFIFMFIEPGPPMECALCRGEYGNWPDNSSIAFEESIAFDNDMDIWP